MCRHVHVCVCVHVRGLCICVCTYLCMYECVHVYVSMYCTYYAHYHIKDTEWVFTISSHGDHPNHFSCYDLHYSILTTGTEGHELLKGLSTTRSGLLRLDRIQPLQEVLPQNVSNKLKFAISDGMNLSPLPKVTPYK